MKTKILFHLAEDRNGGEFRRVKRLSLDFDKKFNYRTIEIVLLPITHLFKNKEFKSSKLGEIQICFPIFLLFRRYSLIREINKVSIRIISFLIRKYYTHELVWSETPLSFDAIKGSNKVKIMDIHGAFPEETDYVLGVKFNKRIVNGAVSTANKLEQHAIFDVDMVIYQSDMMKNHIQEKYKCAPKRSLIYQCGVDTDLFDYKRIDDISFRKELGYNETDQILIYVGGLHRWQLVYDTLLIFKEMCKFNNYKYLILSQDDPTSIKEFCEENNILGVTVLYKIPHCDVYKYLSISDLAWLIRENIILNKVASPTKLGEYLACGVPVIVAPVSKYWKWTKGYSSAFCLIDYSDVEKSAKAVTQFLSLRQVTRDTIRQIAVDELSSISDYNALAEVNF